MKRIKIKKIVFKSLCLSLMLIVAFSASGCSILENILPTPPNNSGFIYVEDDEKTLTIYGVVDKKTKALKIPSRINLKKVTSIDIEAFSSLDNLEEVIMPNTIDDIGQSAFAGDPNLKKVTLSKNIDNIGWSCFIEDVSLTEVNLPSYLKTISACAFSGCSSLEKITIPNKTEKIEANAFAYCEKLKEVHIPSSVKFMQNGAGKYASTFNHSPNVTIYAPKGSYAEKYAKQENIKFIAE